MKLALIGGGGVRAPEFVRGALAFAGEMGLQELWLMDTDEARMKVVAPLCEQILAQAGNPFTLKYTADLDEALRDAALIVTTIRVGLERGRVLDERVALRQGVLGQETTGPGGFSMALRSVPALLHIAERTEALAPRAWTFNFTNPAGLVTQALYDAGCRRIVGICDGANGAQQAIAHYLKRPLETVKTEVFGLNHLSWTRQALIGGHDVLPELLQNRDFIGSTPLRFFGADLVGRLGMYLNEYLYYYYYRDVALSRIQEEKETRGEEVERLNGELFETLAGTAPEDLLATYAAYNSRRNASYMAYAEEDEGLRRERSHPTAETVFLSQEEVGGYAGVALQSGLALVKDKPLRIGLNVPNGTSISGMRADDVVEVTCEVDGSGVRPIAIGEVPEASYILMRAVKRYERLGAKAILERDRELAVEALVAHPLVGSYALAGTLINDYLEAHGPFIGPWR